jgi:hypothetical protein
MYFDWTLSFLHNADLTSKILCISRYDVTANGSIRFNEWTSKLSQDSWIFRSPVPLEGKLYSNYFLTYREAIAVDFLLGHPGCDNRIAHEFQQIGWKVINPCRKIIFRHLHNVEKRNYSKENTVQGPYSFVYPTNDI